MASLDGLTSGQSSTVTWTDIDGNKKFEILESFTFRENSNISDETAIDGVTRHPKFYMGWHGSAVYQRGSSALDDYFASQERNYYLGGDQINMTITQTIKEVNGSTTQWQFTGVVLMMEDGGSFSGTAIVKQSISWKANRRMKL